MEKEYKNFCEKLKRILEKKFEDDSYHIEFHSIEKNNSVKYDGIVIYSSQSNVSPNFSLDALYEKYKEGISMEMLVEQLALRYYSEQIQIKDMSLDMDYEKCRERIICRLISYEKNEELLKTTPHVCFLDMAVVFYVLVFQSEEKVGSFRITNNLMKMWNIDQEHLMRLACENTKKLFPLKIHNMHQMILEILSRKKKNMELERYFQNEIAEDIKETPVILTTGLGINGAAVLLYDDTLHVVSDMFQGNFYILPSSIHEVLALPFSSGQPFRGKELKNIVCEVNRECVLKDEFLSDHVYLYDVEKDALEICV